MTSSSARRLRHGRRVIPGEQAGSLSAPSLVAEDVPLPLGDQEGGEAADPFEATRRRAFDEGYRAALEASAREERSHEEAARRIVEAVADAATRIARERQSVLDEAVADAVDLALELVGVLLGRELDAADSPTRDAVVRALSMTPEGEDLVVRLPPGSSVSEDDVRGLAPTARVRVVEDPSVEEHGCVVEAGRARIDAQLSSAIERVRDQLEPLRRHHRSENPG